MRKLEDLKFRVYHSGQKIDLGDRGYGQIEYALSYRDDGFILTVSEYGERVCTLDEITVEQYTGEKSFEAEEIYEGDLLLLDDGLDTIGLVEWNDHRGSWDLMPQNEEKGFWMIEGDSTFTDFSRYAWIVGNLHDGLDKEKVARIKSYEYD